MLPIRFAASPLPDNPAVHQCQDALCLLREGGGVRDHDNRSVLFLMKLVEQVHDRAARLRIQCAGRLIRQNDRRIVCHRPRNRNSLLLASGELCRRVIHPVSHPYHLQQLRGALHPFLHRNSRVEHRHGDVLQRRRPRDQVVSLKYKPNFPVSDPGELILRRLADILPPHQIAALRRMVQQPDLVHQCALSGSGFSHDADKIAVVDIHSDTVKHLEFILRPDIEPLHDMLEMNDRLPAIRAGPAAVPALCRVLLLQKLQHLIRFRLR